MAVRQVQVQQDQAERLPVFPDERHGFRAGFRDRGFIVLLQDHPEDLPVDKLILHDQDQAPPVGGGKIRHGTDEFPFSHAQFLLCWLGRKETGRRRTAPP